MRTLTTAVSLMACSFTAHAGECPHAIPESSLALVERDPRTEAQMSASSGTPRFWAVASDGFYVPGAPGSGFCWGEANLTRRIEGTTDVICSEAERVFQDRAWTFAKVHNVHLLELNAALRQHQCASSKPDYE
jgi:hypothetical protein